MRRKFAKRWHLPWVTSKAMRHFVITTLEDGSTVVLRTEAGRAEVTVRVTGQIAAGVVFVPWNQPGLAANTLLSGSPITTVAVEVPTAVPA